MMGLIWQELESAVVWIHHRRGRLSLLSESIQRHLGGQKGYGWAVPHQMAMDSKVMTYRVDWLRKFMFPVRLMDCWSLYILDTEKKIMMVLDPTETDPSDEMKIEHGLLARKFQQKLCVLFNDMFGAGLVENTGWSFVYPLVAQHASTSHAAGLYILEFTSLYLRSTLTQGQIEHLRKKIAYKTVTMTGNKGDIPEFLHEEIID